MAKFTLKRLSRGVALLTSHIHAQVTSALALLTNTGVEEDNLEKSYGTFRLNLSIPWLPGRNQSAAGGTDVQQNPSRLIPFTLPPLQEFFTITGAASLTTPEVVLDEIGLSFDQRAEGAAIATFYDDGGAGADTDEGALYYSKVTEYDLTLILWEKEMSVWGSSATDTDKIIYTVSLNAEELFEGKDLKLNPLALSDLELTLNPYRTYMLEIRSQSLRVPTSPGIAFNNMLASLRFRHALVERDSSESYVQNIPTVHDGDLNTSPVTISTPASDAVIEADNASTGVNTVLEAVDNIFRSKMNAGYNEKSVRRSAERIKDNAGYEVIAVPMWGNTVPEINGANFEDLPSPTPQSAHHTDRRIIPLVHPMTIHHVIAVANTGETANTVATFTNTVGVGIGSGVRADQPRYAQVAFAEWTPVSTSLDDYLLDTIAHRIEVAPSTFSITNMQVLNIPVTYVSGLASAKNYGAVNATLSDGGKPFFVGQTNSGLMARSDASNTLGGSATSSAGRGREQFIEVRWDVYDSGGFNASAYTGGSTPLSIIGSGGHWVYIIGKKHLA
jgi:hypothetical protein